MISFESFRKLALSFPEATEEPHFEKTSFRVKKKIFATYDDAKKRACIKLSEIEQDVFSSVDKTIIFPVDNKCVGFPYLVQVKSIQYSITFTVEGLSDAKA